MAENVELRLAPEARIDIRRQFERLKWSMLRGVFKLPEWARTDEDLGPVSDWLRDQGRDGDADELVSGKGRADVREMDKAAAKASQTPRARRLMLR